MALNARQSRFFSDLADFYKPADRTMSSKRVSSTFQVEATAEYTDVQCRIQPSSELLEPGQIGRQDYDVMDTTDVLRVELSQEVGAGWFVQLKSPAHPEVGTWYAVIGDAKNLTWRANSRLLYLKRTTRPAGVIV